MILIVACLLIFHYNVIYCTLKIVGHLIYEMSSGYIVIDERIHLARSDYQNVEDSELRRVTHFIFDMAKKKKSCRELMEEVKYLLLSF